MSSLWECLILVPNSVTQSPSFTSDGPVEGSILNANTVRVQKSLNHARLIFLAIVAGGDYNVSAIRPLASQG